MAKPILINCTGEESFIIIEEGSEYQNSGKFCSLAIAKVGQVTLEIEVLIEELKNGIRKMEENS